MSQQLMAPGYMKVSCTFLLRIFLLLSRVPPLFYFSRIVRAVLAAHLAMSSIGLQERKPREMVVENKYLIIKDF
ncbi:hypothetical protein B0H63DRAFT_469166 [Podospora didyma]|uniref:Uncharacterized protein n=1 Tax=Podospora didyma TaxID=330526 RepID=A0AAE0NT17_9PEZI|nr:hypothetical protein B0H63DRAFT_469166 [Podospora didyma]